MDKNGKKNGQPEERYPGESRGLALFLEELAPVVARELGSDHLLHHAIGRALRTRSLKALRHARRLFNALPRPFRQGLSRAMLARPEPAPPRETLLHRYRQREPELFICFDAEPGDPGPRRIEQRHELVEDAHIRVMIKPGTLPSGAAEALRNIADRIEADRRLLSGRHWRAAWVRQVIESGEDGEEHDDEGDNAGIG